LPRRSRRPDGRGDRAIEDHLRGKGLQIRRRQRRPRESEKSGKPDSNEKNQEKDDSFAQRGPCCSNIVAVAIFPKQMLLRTNAEL
jgi:hypothetical protein